MRGWWRAGAFLLLAVLAAALVWVGVATLLHKENSAPKRIGDLGATNPLNQPGSEPVSPEAYEVYSALYQVPADEPLAFSNESFTDIPQVGGSCLKPASRDDREMMDAFVAANQQSQRWNQRFSIPQSYLLLTAQEISELRACFATGSPKGAQCERYKGVKHVRLLGVPGFNSRHTRALVSVIKSCGSFCGSGGIFAVERAGNTWRRTPTTDFTRDCSWVY